MVDWEARWSGRGAGEGAGRLYGAEPNAGFVGAVARWLREASPPRTALMLADGDGRNGAWLAGLGVAVTALDLSPVATEQARRFDADAGGRVERLVGDATLWADPRRFDLVAIVYLHGPEALRDGVLAAAIRALAPGGRLFLEGFSTAQAGGAYGPKDPIWLHDRARLVGQARAAGVTIEEALEGEASLAEGRGHDGPARIVRLMARRAS